MLGIPFLSSYITRVVKEHAVADSTDWLNYYASALLLAFFALAISAKQYFGTPINCFTPQEFKRGWDRYSENYCFIANSYYVPMEEDIPSDISERRDSIIYYRWVPVVLAAQALLFWLPSWLWSMLVKQTAVNPKAVINEALQCRAAAPGAARDNQVESLALYIEDTLSVFKDSNGRRCQMGVARSGYSATFLYLFIKLLYVMNVVGQLFALNQLLGGNYLHWGWATLQSVFRGQPWQESDLFPRVIMCDFVIRLLGNSHRHTLQCVIMMNAIHEKVYFFLFAWLMVVALVTTINFFYHLMVLCLPILRTKFILANINRHEHRLRGMTPEDMERFVQHFLRADGVLLLHFVRQHIGGRITYCLLNELLRIHWVKCNQAIGGGGIGSGEGGGGGPSTKSSPISSKRKGLSDESLHEGKLQRPMGQSTPIRRPATTYKPTLYGHEGLYPHSIANPLASGVQTLDATAPPQYAPAPSSPSFSQQRTQMSTPFLDYIDTVAGAGVESTSSAAMTPAPMTPAPMTPAPMTPAPMTPAPMTPTPSNTGTLPMRDLGEHNRPPAPPASSSNQPFNPSGNQLLGLIGGGGGSPVTSRPTATARSPFSTLSSIDGRVPSTSAAGRVTRGGSPRTPRNGDNAA